MLRHLLVVGRRMAAWKLLYSSIEMLGSTDWVGMWDVGIGIALCLVVHSLVHLEDYKFVNL